MKAFILALLNLVTKLLPVLLEWRKAYLRARAVRDLDSVREEIGRREEERDDETLMESIVDDLYGG